MVFDSLQSIANMMATCAWIEVFPLRKTSFASRRLWDSLTALYKGILWYMLKIRSYLQRPTLRKHIYSLGVLVLIGGIGQFATASNPFTTGFQERFQKLRDLLQDVDNDRVLVRDENSEYNAHEHRSKLQDLEKVLVGMSPRMDALEDRVETIADQNINKMRYEDMDWVSRMPYSDHQADKYGKVTPGTGEWFLEHRKLKEWRDGKIPSVLWLRGSPGTGKTTLV